MNDQCQRGRLYFYQTDVLGVPRYEYFCFVEDAEFLQKYSYNLLGSPNGLRLHISSNPLLSKYQ